MSSQPDNADSNTPFDSAFYVSYTEKGTSGDTIDGPFILPPYWIDATVPPLQGTISLFIPNVVADGVPEGSYSLTGVNLFSLDVVSQSGELLAKVSIATDSVLSATDQDALYDALFDDFIALRTAVETLTVPGGSDRVLIPLGTDVLMSRIASNLPLRVDQWLRFWSVSSAASQWVDLSPGMRVVIQRAGYSLQYDESNLSPAQNAFAGDADLLIKRATDGSLRFSPFLATLSALKSSGNTWSNGEAFGGYLDFGTATLNLKHARLIYPKSMPYPDPDGMQDPSVQDGVVLVAADSYADLTTATTAIRKGSPSSVGQSVFLIGRSGVSVRIAVWLNGACHWVELGTTVRDLLDWQVVATGLDLTDAVANRILNIDFKRLNQPSMMETNQPDKPPYLAYRAITVSFELLAPEGWSSDLSTLDLPLQMGDRINVDWAEPSPGGS